ncbi:carboxypeptidase-like regulatory domain-containing protein [Mucilaginibacter mali]|uniref:Carboxypeptidase-like regulatory domain-containing protein n=1 Tax=Mucilaginibacter mali TaxID=2740462 RepID=A0A7D4UMB7_9SPHI|nr:DUF5686 and carboxypeptidase-like regulatory domain-containing protein [Mucilaginibacter mali]QKJ30901.1 carboxypeptidase-like regulatory domain-containing protein [Mucilaginibacter mali]
MNFNRFIKNLLLPLLLLFCSIPVFAQSTIVSGTVTDANTKQPLSFVTVAFNGSTIGINTTDQGKYTLRTSRTNLTQIKASFVGYKPALLTIVPGKTQVINIRLFPEAQALQEVTVKSGKKQKYTNKDNPAVELIRQVIEHKPQNRPEAYDFVEYRAYDKLQLSFINVSTQLAEKKFFRKYKFILDNRDTTLVPGKSLLPMYLDEKLTQNYYRKNPEKKRTVVLGQKSVNFGAAIDHDGLGQYIKHIYADVDIYDNNIFLITNNFLSPISNSAPTFYKFFITDTVMVNNNKLIELSFTPRNTTDLLFEGKIYITQDGNFAVQKAELIVNKNINLNFVKSLTVNLDFEQNPDGRYHLSKSDILADFGLNKKKNGGIFGDRTITYKNYIVNKQLPDTTYTKEEPIEVSDEVKHRSDDFWEKNRLDTLTTAESKVYKNIDSLSKMPSFRRTMDIATLVLAGYKSFGPFEMGPANAFYSFNPIEGFRLRLGGRTTPELSKRYYFETYGAYGFKDEKWKYFFSATYSLNDKSIYKFPQNYIRASVNRDTKIPGQNLQFVQEDNFLLSFKRGENDKYLYNDFYKLNYVHEYYSHFSYALTLSNWTQSPAGSLYFIQNANTANANTIHSLTTTEAELQLRYAPHEQFYQGKIYRIPIPNTYPIFTVNYTQGIKNVFNSSYNYQNIDLRWDQHILESIFGYSDISVEGNRILGNVPYPLLNIHQANQTYAYDIESYNLMNFLEFVSDKYVALKIDQHWEGFFFNKIPLLKKLKLRETTSFKLLYGSVGDNNNPNIHPSLYAYPVQANGAPITYGLGNTPYMEGSVGVENIFKFIRVDAVKRFSYLDHPGIATWGLRTRVKFDF